jgi:hypothetical protein
MLLPFGRRFHRYLRLAVRWKRCRRSAKNPGANLIAAEVPSDGSEFVEAGVVGHAQQVDVGDKVRHLVDLAHTCQGEVHLTRMAGRRRVCSRAHGAACRSRGPCLDGPALVA